MYKILLKINLHERKIVLTRVKCLHTQNLLLFFKNNQITTGSHTIFLINQITMNKRFNMISLTEIRFIYGSQKLQIKVAKEKGFVKVACTS